LKKGGTRCKHRPPPKMTHQQDLTKSHFNPNLELKLCLPMFSKKQKCRHPKDLTIPKNDDNKT
ncbi:hypothetical protein NOF63_08100, partial [Limosilactobacillus fermentum]|uniref:hypothetical protein n=1 Tax=Limosilactobacillus fermentum TaxID=1613 RepID=UPI002102AAB5